MLLNPKFTHRQIEGWFNFARLYDHIVREAKEGDVIAEIGTWFGKSACYLGQKAKLSGKGLQIIAVDTFKGSPNETLHSDILMKLGANNFYRQFIENMIKSGVIDVITPLAMDSLEAAKRIPANSLFAVYIDGNHAEDSVIKDIRAWFPKVKNGGIIAGHDIILSSVQNAVKKSFGEYEKWDDCWSWYVRKQTKV